MRAILQIRNEAGKSEAHTCQHGDLYRLFQDLVCAASIGDKVTIQFEFDLINHNRANNFISIMQLYEKGKS